MLFISLIQSVNGAQFLNITPLFLSSNRFLHYLVCSSNCYSSTYKYVKVNLKIKALNLIWVMVLYVPSDSAFISTHFFVLNLVGWFSAFFDIPLLYCYINIKIINNCLSFFWNIHFSLGISLSFWFVIVSKLSSINIEAIRTVFFFMKIF